eukprot:TRINITY_DN2383_c0_g2_i1.p2 TRINITY_DN2383_c0_g2~~TRINITY_DN2383_c0_g2_i1.p2  ORF type:complete len:139 (-),score=26.73 TRINITY_DN2383_c0_g2_i1:256-672(-)
MAAGKPTTTKAAAERDGAQGGSTRAQALTACTPACETAAHLLGAASGGADAAQRVGVLSVEASTESLEQLVAPLREAGEAALLLLRGDAAITAAIAAGGTEGVPRAPSAHEYSWSSVLRNALHVEAPEKGARRSPFVW